MKKYSDFVLKITTNLIEEMSKCFRTVLSHSKKCLTQVGHQRFGLRSKWQNVVYTQRPLERFVCWATEKDSFGIVLDRATIIIFFIPIKMSLFI